MSHLICSGTGMSGPDGRPPASMRTKLRPTCGRQAAVRIGCYATGQPATARQQGQAGVLAPFLYSAASPYISQRGGARVTLVHDGNGPRRPPRLTRACGIRTTWREWRRGLVLLTLERGRAGRGAAWRSVMCLTLRSAPRHLT
ncbi:hypothetical protein E2C01_075148 [Portunus trituberculatus]|uniref:Uncharacterized protein n=1 Tax=Portunus trituberculatus TaxID=210409 RepID=A0A5B7IF28_PORTR|nr:hypothetical protein [Portunus trituberculatus]